MSKNDLVILDDCDIELGITKNNIIKSLERGGLTDIKLERKKDYSEMGYKEKYYHKTLKENIEGMELTLKGKKEKIKVYDYELSVIRFMNDRSLNKLKLKIISNRNKEEAEMKLYKSWYEGYMKVKSFLDKKKNNKV